MYITTTCTIHHTTTHYTVYSICNYTTIKPIYLIVLNGHMFSEVTEED